MHGSDDRTLSAHLDPLVRRIIDGRYEILDVIGTGGMATVYRGRDRRLDRTVALKVLHPQFAADPDFVTRFHREAHFAAGLSSHPNVVAIHDVGDVDSTHYIVMELVDGRNLKHLIAAEAPLGVERAFGLIGQLASALQFAHEHGLVHRDVKPENILVTPDEQVKVTDFGIARGPDATQITRMGIVLGTVGYLSPEQARGKVVGPSSDIYSAGVVLFQMLTGRLPFEAESAVAMAVQHLHEQPVPPSQVNPALPASIDPIVMKALAKDPSDRYQSAAELQAALRQIPEGSAGTTVYRPLGQLTENVPETSTAERHDGSVVSQRAVLFGPLALLLIAATALGGWLIWGSHGRAGDSPHRATHSGAPPSVHGGLPHSTATATLRPTPPRAAAPLPTATVTATPTPTPTSGATLPPTPTQQPTVTPAAPTSNGRGKHDKGPPPGQEKKGNQGQDGGDG